MTPPMAFYQYALLATVLVASTWAQSSANSRSFDNGEWVPMNQPCPTCREDQNIEANQQIQEKSGRVLNSQVAFQRNFFPGQQSQRNFLSLPTPSSPQPNLLQGEQKQLKSAPILPTPTEKLTPQFPPRLEQVNFNQLPFSLQNTQPFLTQNFLNQNGQFVLPQNQQQPRLIQPQSDFQLIQQVLHNSKGQFAESIFSINNDTLTQNLNNLPHLTNPTNIQQYNRETAESQSVNQQSEKSSIPLNQQLPSTQSGGIQDKQDIQLVYVPLETYRKTYQNQKQQSVSPTVTAFPSTVSPFLDNTNVFNQAFLQSTLQPQNIQQKSAQQQILLPQNVQQQFLHLQNVQQNLQNAQQNLQNTQHQFFLPELSTTLKPIVTTTPKSAKSKSKRPKPHQPPLAVYMEAPNHDPDHVNITDVLMLLKDAKTISVLDNVSPNSPQVFIGPKNLNPPDGYVKFELPYLSTLENNRIQRKVDQLPFFVAPLSYKAPDGYAKIPFPAPHVGSVVVSTMKEPLHEKQETKPTQTTGTQYRGSSQGDFITQQLQETITPSSQAHNNLNQVSSTVSPQYVSNPDVLLNPFTAFIQASQIPVGHTTNNPSVETVNTFHPSTSNFFTSPRPEATTTPPQYSVRGHFITNTAPNRQTISVENHTQRPTLKYRTDKTDVPNSTPTLNDQTYTILEQFPVTQEVSTQKETKYTENVFESTTPSFQQQDFNGNPLAFGINDQLANIQSNLEHRDLQNNRHLTRQQKQQAQQIYNQQLGSITEKEYAPPIYLNQQLQQNHGVSTFEEQVNRQQTHRLRPHKEATTTENARSTTPEQQFTNTYISSTASPNVEITSEYIQEYPFFIDQGQQKRPGHRESIQTPVSQQAEGSTVRTPHRTRGRTHNVPQHNFEASLDSGITPDTSQDGFSLPPNLPPINPNLPGLINSLQDTGNYQQVSVVPNTVYRQQQVSETPNVYKQTPQQVTELPTIYKQTQQVSETPNIYRQTVEVSETPNIYRQTAQQVSETPINYQQNQQLVSNIYQLQDSPNVYQRGSSTPDIYQQIQHQSSTPQYISPITEPTTTEPTTTTTTRRPSTRGRTRINNRPHSSSSATTTSTTPSPRRNAPRRRRPYNGRPRPEYEKYLQQNRNSNKNENQYVSSTTEVSEPVKTISESSYVEVSSKLPATKNRYVEYENETPRNKYSNYQDDGSKTRYQDESYSEQSKRANRQRFRTRTRPTKASTEAPNVITESNQNNSPLTERSDISQFSTEPINSNFQTPKLENGFQISTFGNNQQTAFGSQYNEQVIPVSQQQPVSVQNSVFSNNPQSDIIKYQNIPETYQTTPIVYQQQQSLTDHFNQPYHIQNEQLQQQLQQSQAAGHQAIQNILEVRNRQNIPATASPLPRNPVSSTTLRIQPEITFNADEQVHDNVQYIQQTIQQQTPQIQTVVSESPEITQRPSPIRTRGRTRTRSRHHPSTPLTPSSSTTTTEKHIQSQQQPLTADEDEFYGFIRQPNFPKPAPTELPSSVKEIDLVDKSSPQYAQLTNPSLPYISPTAASLAAIAGDEHLSNYQGLVNSPSTEGASDEITTRRPINVNFIHRGRTPGARPTAFPVVSSTRSAPTNERYTVRPTKKPEVEQQKVTRVRGRIRKPTTSTSTTESVVSSGQEVAHNNQPTYAGRRPFNHRVPVGTNELIDADSEEIVPNRRAPSKYASRGRAQFKVPQTATERVSSDSDEHDNYPNYPAHFLEAQQKAQQHEHRPETGTSKPEFRITVGPSDDYEDQDQVPYSTVNRPRVVPQNPEDGGAESQWHSKKYVSTSFRQTNQIPSEIEKTENKTTEDVDNKTINETVPDIVTEKTESLEVTETPVTTEISPDTDIAQQESSSNDMQTVLDKFLQEMTEEQEEENVTTASTELTSTEKSRRRGAWKKIRVRPVDVLETAESQNVASSAANSLLSDSDKKVYPRPAVEQYKMSFEPELTTKPIEHISSSFDERKPETTKLNESEEDSESKIDQELTTDSPAHNSESDAESEEYDFFSSENDEDSREYRVPSETNQGFDLIPPKLSSNEDIVHFDQESDVNTQAPGQSLTTEGTMFNSFWDMFDFSNDNETSEPVDSTTVTVEEQQSTTIIPDTVTESTTNANQETTTVPFITTTEVNNDMADLNNDDIELLKTQQLNETKIISDKIKMYTERKDEQERQKMSPEQTTQRISDSEKGWEALVIGTSTSTEISHETEICFRGKCIRSNSTDNSKNSN